MEPRKPSRAHVPAGRVTVRGGCWEARHSQVPAACPHRDRMRHFPGPRPAPAPESRRAGRPRPLRHSLPPDACPPCMPTSNGPPPSQIARSTTAPAPRQSDLPTSRYQIWLPVLLLFWKPGRLALQQLGPILFCPTSNSHESTAQDVPSEVLSLSHRRRGQQRRVLGTPDRDAAGAPFQAGVN